jgi:hypothetical protein
VVIIVFVMCIFIFIYIYIIIYYTHYYTLVGRTNHTHYAQNTSGLLYGDDCHTISCI